MYELWMGEHLFPVPPEKVTVKVKGNNKTVTLINEGEVNMLKTAKLTEISFDIMLPNSEHPWVPIGTASADSYLSILEGLKQKEEGFKFKLIRKYPNGELLFNTSLAVSLEDYTCVDSWQDGFDQKVSITLKQYKAYGTKKLVVKKKGDKTTFKVSVKRAGKTVKSYKIKKGDTMASIARTVYGKADAQYRDVIAKTNKKTLNNMMPNKKNWDGKTLKIGATLKIPRIKVTTQGEGAVTPWQT